MVAWGGTKAVGMAIGNQKVIGGAWKGQKFKFETVFEWSGACDKFFRSGSTNVKMPRNSAVALPSDWIVGGGAAYLTREGGFSYPVVYQRGDVWLYLAPAADASTRESGPQLTSRAESSLRMEFIHASAGTLVITGTGNDGSEPYEWRPPNSAQVTAWVRAVSDGDNVRVRFIL